MLILCNFFEYVILHVDNQYILVNEVKLCILENKRHKTRYILKFPNGCSKFVNIFYHIFRVIMNHFMLCIVDCMSIKNVLVRRNHTLSFLFIFMFYSYIFFLVLQETIVWILRNIYQNIFLCLND